MLLSPEGPLLHFAPLRLRPGTVIDPGNWGRILKLRGINDPSWWREIAWEQYRAANFPDRPSRFACAFVFISGAAAAGYRPSTMYVLHRVRLASPGLGLFVTRMNLVPGPRPPFDPAICHAYWQGVGWAGGNHEAPVDIGPTPDLISEYRLIEGMPELEGLTTSPLLVEEILDPP